MSLNEVFQTVAGPAARERFGKVVAGVVAGFIATQVAEEVYERAVIKRRHKTDETD